MVFIVFTSLEERVNNSPLWSCPLDSCNENERQAIKGDDDSKGSNAQVEWCSNVEKNMSLISLRMGICIEFGGMVVLFMS